MRNTVTPKENAFAEAIVMGASLADAYKTAYDTKLTGQALHTNGQTVFRRTQVQERIEELRKEVNQKFAISVDAARAEQIAFINERIEVCKIREDEQSIIRYTDMLNKIYGIYREQTSEQAEPNKLESIDADALARIAEVI